MKETHKLMVEKIIKRSGKERRLGERKEVREKIRVIEKKIT